MGGTTGRPSVQPRSLEISLDEISSRGGLEVDGMTFYTFDAHGYTDYPFYDLCAAVQEAGAVGSYRSPRINIVGE